MERNIWFAMRWMTRLLKYKESGEKVSLFGRETCEPAFSGRPNRLAGYTCIFLLFVFGGKSAECFSQTFDYQVENVRFLEALKALESKSGYSIFYDQEIVDESTSISVDLKNADLTQVLETVLMNRSITYNIQGKTIFLYGLSEKDSESVIPESDPIEIEGKVSGQDGEPLIGVNVRIKETNKGTATDFDGRFELQDVDEDAVLIFSYIGYETQEIPLNGSTEISVILIEDSQAIEEVVVVGYGTKKKSNLIGSISSLTSDEIEKSQQHDLISVLQGRAAGVQVTTSSGAPGGGMTIQVRGASSLNSGNSPLFIVDGIPLESNSMSLLNQDDPGVNPIADINPNDIESIEVLKDAASTAIYGARAANGVVLITTKRGKAGKPIIKLNAYTGLSEVPRKLGVLNATQWRSAVLDAYDNMDNPDIPHSAVVDSLSPKNNGDVDWQSEMFRRAHQNSINLSVMGGADNFGYAWSASYLNQEGILINTDYKRITSRLNTDLKVTDRLTIGQSISYTNGAHTKVNSGGVGNKSLIRQLLIRPPTYAMYLPDGSYNGYQNGQRNPVGLANLATDVNQSHRMIGSQYVEVELMEALKIRSNMNLDYISMKEDYFLPSSLDYREGWNEGKVRSSGNLTWGNETYLSYNHMLNNRHNFSVMGGLGFQRWKRTITGLDGINFASDRIITLNGAGTISNQQVNRVSEHALRSYFGRISYDYEGRYLAEANLRVDGSSRFGKNQRYGFFPSASLGWRFTGERFMADQNIISDGKLRISAGRTGNESIGDYTAQGQFLVGTNYLNNSGAAPTITSNADLTWETTTEYDVGLDLSFLNHRIEVAVDVYLKKTSGLLFNVPVPLTTGFESVTQNVGNIENRGIEGSFVSRNVVGEFQWNTSFNISTNRNRITSLPSELLTNGYIQNGPYHILQVGQPIGIFYGYKFLGVYATDEDNVKGLSYGANGPVFKGGEPIWHDANNDNIIDENDRVIIGDATPMFWGGMNNGFSYKGFSLEVFLQFVYGNDIYSVLNHERNSIRRYDNLSTDALNRWRKQGDITTFPKPVRDDPRESDSRIQDRWIEDGSYMKIKNVMLSYDLNRDLISRIGLSTLQIYLSATDLLTFTRYTAFDPDVNSFGGIRPGVDYGTYPLNRSFFFGIKAEF